MQKWMRVKLALFFMSIVLFLHVLGAGTSIFLLDKGLRENMDRSLMELLAEIRPSVQIIEGRPSLKSWAETVKRGKLKIPASIQLYDAGGRLLEEYGPPGVPRLGNGRLESYPGAVESRVRSWNESIVRQGVLFGHLQVQDSSRQKNNAIKQAIYAALLVMPFLGALVALIGYWFASVALTPIEEGVQLMRRFVADAGHELNTPVAIISASLETLEEVLREHNLSQDLTDTIAKATARMSELASDLVFLARVEDPMSAYPIGPIKSKGLIEDLAGVYDPLASQKNIRLKLLQIDDAEVVGNAEFLRRMLSNLLSNGLRYTDPGGEITISTELTPRYLDIHVSDTGMGIPPESLQRVFDRFYRVDKARSRLAGGAGLGLSIVKAVVEAHGGKVSVASEVDRGSTFTVSIPLSRRVQVMP